MSKKMAADLPRILKLLLQQNSKTSSEWILKNKNKPTLRELNV